MLKFLCGPLVAVVKRLSLAPSEPQKKLPILIPSDSPPKSGFPVIKALRARGNVTLILNLIRIAPVF